MTREDFRRELGDAFDSMSGSPSPDLSERVRSALVEAPERHDQVWIAALAAAVIAVILVGVLLIGNPLNRGPLTPGGPGHNTPTPCSQTCPPPPATPSPTPSPTASPAAICSASALTTNQSPPSALIDRVDAGSHTANGYDRLTIEFQNGQPFEVDISTQANTNFTLSPSGQPARLAGKHGIKVIIKGSDGHTAYSGPRDIKKSYPGLVEVRVLEDFEGQVILGLGLNVNACYHAFILSSPTRLVIDIPTS